MVGKNSLASGIEFPMRLPQFPILSMSCQLKIPVETLCGHFPQQSVHNGYLKHLPPALARSGSPGPLMFVNDVFAELWQCLLMFSPVPQRSAIKTMGLSKAQYVLSGLHRGLYKGLIDPWLQPKERIKTPESPSLPETGSPPPLSLQAQFF